MFRDKFNRWVRAPLLTGRTAALCAGLAFALPTLVRVAVNGVVTGCEFTPYLPFVFLCAVMLRWWQAGAVALASVAIMGGVLEGPPRHMLALPCFLSSAGIFLASSAAMIAMAVLVRRIIARLLRPDDSSGGIIFSLERGEVWASWYGHGQPVRLGSRNTVARMMEDFLKQEQLAKRLARGADYRADV
jgi:hypothetical protein